MVRDTPKAAHFEAIQSGRVLHGLDPVGLSARWVLAHRLSNYDMLHLFPGDREAIDKTVADVNVELAPHGISLRLRESDG